MAPLMGMPLGWGPICGSQAVLEVEEVEAAKKKKKSGGGSPQHGNTPVHLGTELYNEGTRGRGPLLLGPRG